MVFYGEFTLYVISYLPIILASTYRLGVDEKKLLHCFGLLVSQAGVKAAAGGDDEERARVRQCVAVHGKIWRSIHAACTEGGSGSG